MYCLTETSPSPIAPPSSTLSPVAGAGVRSKESTQRPRRFLETFALFVPAQSLRVSLALSLSLLSLFAHSSVPVRISVASRRPQFISRRLFPCARAWGGVCRRAVKTRVWAGCPSFSVLQRRRSLLAEAARVSRESELKTHAC